jgi:hypothetical protein
MCFSATASFAAGSGLGAIGIASWQVAPERQRLIGAIPLLFGVQQVFEGFQWLALNAGVNTELPGYAFLFFAILLWPVYIPMTVFALDEKRKAIMRWLVLLGLALTLVMLAALALEPLGIHVLNRSLHYQLDVPIGGVAVAVYFVVVCGALLFSSKPAFRWFGVVLLLAAAGAATFFLTTFISVWCFFSALLSSLIFFYLKCQQDLRRPNMAEPVP